MSLLDFVFFRNCRHTNGRQLLLWLAGYSLIFCLIMMTALNHKFLGYFRGSKFGNPAVNSAQLILRRIPSEQQEEEHGNVTNFIFTGNASIPAERTQKETASGGVVMETKARHVTSMTSKSQLKGLDDYKHKKGRIENDERTGESIAAENAVLWGQKNVDSIFRPKPLTIQYFHSVIDNEPFTNRYNSCAIVSSSGQLLGKNAGQEIDSADCVIRMNAAPIKGFERDVGRRTTIRVACFISSHHLTTQAEDLLGGVEAPEMVLFWGLEAPRSRRKAQSIPKVTSLQRRFMSIKFYSHSNDGELTANRLFERETGASRMDTNSWLSTGWFTLMTALDICGVVRVYGMVPDDHCVHNELENVKYHYYQPNTSPTECNYYKVHEATPKGGHRFMTEKAIFARWAHHYNLTFHYPSWNRSVEEATKKLDTPFAKLFHLKGLKYFQRGGYSRKGESEGELLPILLCVTIVIGLPTLFICIGTCVAYYVDEEVELTPRHRHKRPLQLRLH
ncbi:uncharacterized protein [Diadema antillarum]|uniref:uncharacterized protein n=1 Tax=Diadema antillarum TaxID=105358 RepID=UPI003A87817F